MTMWPEQIELELDGMAQGGDAVGHYEGRAVFASGGLPGEQVRVQLYDRQRNFAKGRVLDVLRAAPERRTSPCPLEDVCGAADWRWIEEAAQLRWKQQVLHDQLVHLGGLDLDGITVGATGAPDAAQCWNYRTTVELHYAAGKLGYYRPQTRNVAAIPACCLHHPAINQVLEALYPLVTDTLPLQGITLRCSPTTNEVLAIFELREEKRAPRDQVGSKHTDQQAMMGVLRKLAQHWQRAIDQPDVRLVGVVAATRNGHELLVGQAFLTQELADVQFLVGPRTFFQVNAFVTPLMVQRVQKLVAPHPHEQLLDVFCGTGTFALPLARQLRRVVGVETFAPAIADARRSADHNGIHNVRWEVGAAEQLLPRLDERFDAVVLDPPRRGCEPAVLAALLKLQPQRIVYVSCHPGTLARDLKQLVAGGYRLTHAEVIDLFPQTHHVESIVKLERVVSGQ